MNDDIFAFLSDQYEKNKENNQSSRLIVPINFDKSHPNWRSQAATWASQKGITLTQTGTYYNGYSFNIS